MFYKPNTTSEGEHFTHLERKPYTGFTRFILHFIWTVQLEQQHHSFLKGYFCIWLHLSTRGGRRQGVEEGWEARNGLLVRFVSSESPLQLLHNLNTTHLTNQAAATGTYSKTMAPPIAGRQQCMPVSAYYFSIHKKKHKKQTPPEWKIGCLRLCYKLSIISINKLATIECFCSIYLFF